MSEAQRFANEAQRHADDAIRYADKAVRYGKIARALALTSLIAALVAIVLVLAACDHPSPPAATVKTCTAEIVAHPHENTWGPGCKGLTQDQHWQATIQAMQQGARG
jgi:hypothetical protein